MKKAVKIGISVGSVVLVGLIISTTLNLWMKALVCHQLNQNIETADSLRISYGNVRVAVLSGKAWIKDAYFCSDTVVWDSIQGEKTECRIDMLSLDGINYYNWLVRRQLNLRGLTVVNPKFRTYFLHQTEQHEGDQLQQQLEQERQQSMENMLRIAQIFIDDATLHRLTIDHASILTEAINDSLKVSIPEFTMSLYDLGYNIKDSLPHYNDSVFHFLIRDVNVYIPKVNMALKVDELKAEPNGIIQVNQVWIKSGINSERDESVITGVDTITIGGFDVAKFNAIKQMDVKNIHLYHPYANLTIDESAQPAKSSQQQSQTQAELDAINQKMMEANLEIATEFITGCTVDTILLHDATIQVQSTSSAFRLQANRISTALYGVGYSLIDQIPYHYNDSVYQFSLGNVDITTPDSLIALSAQNIHYDNGGAFSLGKTHIHYLIDKWELAHWAGNEPVTWVDMYVDSVYTSSKNIVKEARTLEKGFYLDSLYASIDSMYIFRDARYKPKTPYCLPQTVICQLDYPFVINYVQAQVAAIHVETGLTKEAVGGIDLGPLDIHISNVTPIRNSIITTRAKGRMGKASIAALFRMKVNKACNWDITLDAKHIDFHHLDPMLYPLVGIKVGCDVHHLHTSYSGDTAVAKGTFCMEYDNIDIFADKNSQSPIKAVKDLSGLINSAGKTIINPSNPSEAGKEPLAYQVKWKNNKWEDPSLFYLGPVIDGCIETMLPGLFVHKRVKKK